MADIVARALAPVMERRLGQPVVVVNKAGAGGALGTGQVASAKPDGYTLLIALASISTNPEQERLNKRPAPFQLRKPCDRRQLVQVSYASSGVYGVYHVATSMFTDAANIRMNHVPYGGGPPALMALMALLSGEVDVSLITRSVGAPHLRSGKLRPLAAWGNEKWADYPDVPTIHSAGFDVDYQLWSGMFAPAGTPPAVMNVLRDAVRAAVNDAAFKQSLQKQGATLAYLDAPEFRRYWDADARRLISAIQKIGPTN